MNKNDVHKIRDEILEAALPHVPFDGWRWEHICTAAKEAGYEDAMAQAVFPAQIPDVLGSFSDKADRAMLKQLESYDKTALRIRDRIKTALICRYEDLIPHKEAVRQSLLFWARPFHKPRAAKIVWRTADTIWDWAGDTSTDYNHYTKRLLLSGILVSTTLAWLNEKDENMDETKAFLDRRIENVMQLNGVLNKIKKTA